MSEGISTQKPQVNNNPENINFPVYLRPLMKLCKIIKNIVIICFTSIIVGLLIGIIPNTPNVAMMLIVIIGGAYAIILVPHLILCSITIIAIIISRYIYGISIKHLLLPIIGDALIVALPGIPYFLAVIYG